MAFTVNVKPTGVEIGFEVGSIAEAVEILTKEANAITTVMGIKVTGEGQGQEAPTTTRKPRGANKNQPDPASASAPAPAPIPPTPPALQTPSDGSIPPFLDRTAAPPPPPLPAAPPVAPAPPPGGALAAKVVEELNKRAAGAADQGKGLADWLAQSRLVVPGATFAEALEVVKLQTDDKVRAVATALGVS